MKLGGKKLVGPSTEIVVFPRADGDVVFTIQSVLDHDEFAELYPVPTPPKQVLPKIGKVDNPQAPEYIEALLLRNRAHVGWLLMRSLAATENLEWEILKHDDPTTWADWDKEFKVFLTPYEMGYLQQKIHQVNGLDQDRLDEARNDFLAMMEEASESSTSRPSGQDSTQSGEPVSK